MNTAVATRKQTGEVAQVRTIDDLPMNRAIASMEEKFAAALPAHIPPGRYVRAAINAVLKPDIASVAETADGRQSIYESLLKCAADGLLPDGREAALVKFNTKDGDRWVNKAQYMPMVAGIMKKARNSGEIAAIYCHVVYANDVFKVSLVTDGVPVTHEPAMGTRGDVVGVYALCRFKDGGWSQPEIMDVEQVNAIRKRSKTPDGKGPWASDWAEMARKTVIKRAAKYWPSSTDRDGVDVGELIKRDDDLTELSVIESEPVPAKPNRKKAGAAAKALAAPEPEHEPDAPDDRQGDDGDDV
jgi:recombination protein RecT